MSHWGAWQLEESGVKIHAEPLLEVVTGALTGGYLHPYLSAQGEDTEGLIIWANTANLKTRPDRSANAVLLYDRGEVDGDALRRETGMSEHDKPDQSEIENWAYKKLVANPMLAPTALAGLGIEPPAPASAPGVAGNGQGPQPGLPGQDIDQAGSDTNGPPLTRNSPREVPEGTPPAASVLVLEGFVLRALERAGNRIRSRYRSTQPEALVDCPPEQAHCCVGGVTDTQELLSRAWDRLPETAAELGLDPVITVQCLDTYCCTLLTKGFGYDREALVVALRAAQPVRS
jgi:hypothetical protein